MMQFARSASLVVVLLVLTSVGTASAEGRGHGPALVIADSNTEECASREAIAASIARVESANPVGPESGLLVQIAAIEKQISDLRPIDLETCPESLGIAALSGRLERVRGPVQQAVEQDRRRQEILAKPWPEEIKRAVLEKQVQIGMTTEQVTAAWGRPVSINETITATTRDEQWVYPGSTYLYFKKGTLTTIQRKR
jgi:hypothetical protein